MEEKVLLQSNCSLYRVTTKEELDSFSCGDEDLDDFFHQEACLYDGQLLGKTYFFASERSGKDEIVCAFTLANDSIKAALIPNASRNKIQRKIPNSKRTRSYPAVLIGRLELRRIFKVLMMVLAHKQLTISYLGFCYLIIKLVAVLLWLMPITRKMYYVFMERMASNSCTQQKN
mgnify:CR=1 FL=1